MPSICGAHILTVWQIAECAVTYAIKVQTKITCKGVSIVSLETEAMFDCLHQPVVVHGAGSIRMRRCAACTKSEEL